MSKLTAGPGNRKRTRRQHIAATIMDLVSNFVYYDRKEDEELPRGALEEAVKAGEVTVDEMIELFAEQLRGNLTA
jgi:hypothetical protein